MSRIGVIIAALSRLLDFVLSALDDRREAEIENEVRNDVAKDAKIRDLQRAGEIKDRVANVHLDDRLRRADTAGRITEDGYRD